MLYPLTKSGHRGCTLAAPQISGLMQREIIFAASGVSTSAVINKHIA